MEDNCASLQAKLSSTLQELQQCNSKHADYASKQQTVLEGTEARHSRELEDIDSKVRKMLGVKDREIERLGEQLRQIESAKDELEQALLNLHEGLKYR